MSKAAKKSPIKKATKPNTSAATLRAATRVSRSPRSTPTPQIDVKPARFDTKAAAILKMLGRNSGATIKELAAATNWQEHSVRGFLSGALRKKRGLLVTHSVVDGLRRYHVDQTGSGQ